jgi:arabinofuranosyltransferase
MASEAEAPPATLTRGTLCLLAVVLLPWALLVWRFDFQNDDAYISFRYSRHLAEGHGLRFNVGESPPVEGYTNFLWVLWLALLHRVGLDITVWSRVSSIACGAVLVAWFTLFLRRELRLSPVLAGAAGLVLATLPTMTVWATSGLETMPTALFVFGTFASLWATPPRGVRAGVFGALAALMRADGVGYVGLVSLAALLRWSVTHERALLRALLSTGAAVGASLVALVLWRLSYYGDVVPNTAHLKGGFAFSRLVRGWSYVVLNLLTVLPLLVCLLAAVLALARRGAGLVYPALLVVLGTLGYALWVGGDFLPFGRLLVPAAPFFVLCFVGFQQRWLPGAPSRLLACGAMVALSVLASFDRQVVPRSVLERFWFRYGETSFETEVENWTKVKEFTSWWTDLGRALALHTRPGESIVLYNVGIVGYLSELTIYDMYGLTNREAARAAVLAERGTPGHDMLVSPEFFMSYEPTYISAVLVAKGKQIDLSWLERNLSTWFAKVEIVRHELSPEDGFPPDVELILGRIVY